MHYDGEPWKFSKQNDVRTKKIRKIRTVQVNHAHRLRRYTEAFTQSCNRSCSELRKRHLLVAEFARIPPGSPGSTSAAQCRRQLWIAREHRVMPCAARANTT